jgi:5'-phosphate synthase pdxT subunit
LKPLKLFKANFVPYKMSKVRIGVLALQGAFKEHIGALSKIADVEPVEVREVSDIMNERSYLVDGLIIPGGESTSIALIGERNGLLAALKKWVGEARPTWGTCAGCILLANRVLDQKEGGQPIIGGMDITVQRNYFGRQVCSFEADISVDIPTANNTHFPGVFIRAPAILSVNPNTEPGKEPVKILGRIDDPNGSNTQIIVAAKQGPLLATIFHPELTNNTSFHQYFVDLVRECMSSKKRD